MAQKRDIPDSLLMGLFLFNMVASSPVCFISILCNFTQYALTTNFITECFWRVFLLDVTSCGRRIHSLKEIVALQHLPLYLQG